MKANKLISTIMASILILSAAVLGGCGKENPNYDELLELYYAAEGSDSVIYSTILQVVFTNQSGSFNSSLSTRCSQIKTDGKLKFISDFLINQEGEESNLILFSDGENKIMKLELAPGAYLGEHTHVGNSETIYVLSGTGTMLCDGVEEALTPGVCHYCAQGHSHKLMNTGTEPLVTFAIVPEHKK